MRFCWWKPLNCKLVLSVVAQGQKPLMQQPGETNRKARGR